MAATLIAIIWYTVETRRLRIEQERIRELQTQARRAEELQNEYANWPWLVLTLMSRPGGGASDQFIIEIANRGATPAFNVRLELSASGTMQYVYYRDAGDWNTRDYEGTFSQMLSDPKRWFVNPRTYRPRRVSRPPNEE